MSLHLGYAPGEDKPAGLANHRNGSSGKTLLTDTARLLHFGCNRSITKANLTTAISRVVAKIED